MNHRLVQTVVLFLLSALFGERTIASSPPTSSQDQPPSSQQSGETDPREQEEETDPAAQEDDTGILVTHEGDIIYTEIDVTGTVIRETPIDSPNSVSIINRESLSQQGSPSVVELFKNMSVSGGVPGESNSWYNGTSTGIAETVANVNLRSLGASRTLVLLNGRRQTCPCEPLPHAALASAYADPATRRAVQDRIFCPGNRYDGSCDPVDIERIRVHHINWPGIKTSGIDWHLDARRLMGPGVLVGSLDGNHTLDFEVEALLHNGVELRPREEAAGYLNRTNPLAPPLPRWRTHGRLGYHWSHYGLIGAVHYISAYEDRDTVVAYSRIDKFLTFDMNFRWQVPNSGTTLTVSGLNLADLRPPLVNTELAFDSLTHNPGADG